VKVAFWNIGKPGKTGLVTVEEKGFFLGGGAKKKLKRRTRWKVDRAKEKGSRAAIGRETGGLGGGADLQKPKRWECHRGEVPGGTHPKRKGCYFPGVNKKKKQNSLARGKSDEIIPGVKKNKVKEERRRSEWL